MCDYQISCHEPTEGTVHGVICQIKLVTQVQRCFRTVSQDATIENINAYLV